MDLAAAKQALRHQIAARLPKPDSAGFADASLLAQQRLAGNAAVRAAKCVALYRALQSECGTDALADLLSAAGKVLCYPKVLASGRVLRFLRAHGPVSRSALGVDEHADLEAARVELGSIDLFVIPARAVDPNGHRLGRGKGYFDATLAAASERARRICLVFDSQIVDNVPHEEHDQRMDAICSDARWIDCPGRAP